MSLIDEKINADFNSRLESNKTKAPKLEINTITPDFNYKNKQGEKVVPKAKVKY